MKLSRLSKVGLAMLALSFSLQTIASYQDDEISRPKWSSGAQLVLENQSAEKIAAHKGELSLNYVDYSIPGVNGLDIKIHRNYNISELQGFGPFSGIEAWAGPNHGGIAGAGWQIMASPIIEIAWYSGYERYYPSMDPICYGQLPSYPTESGGGNYTIHSLRLPNGEVRALHRSNLLPRVETPDGWVLTCAGGAYTLRAPTGLQYQMSDIWYGTTGAPNLGTADYKSSLFLQATKITDTSGNWIAIEYLTSVKSLTLAVLPQPYLTQFREPKKITASDGRSLDFAYQSYVCGPMTHTMLQKISSPGGEVSYTYICNTESVAMILTRVTLPEGVFWAYDYYPFVDKDPARTVQRGASYNTQLGRQKWTPAHIAEVSCTTLELRSLRLKTVRQPWGGSVNYEYIASPVESVWRHPQHGPGQIYIEDMWMPMPVDGAWRQHLMVSKKTSSDGGVWTYDYTNGTSGQLDQTTIKGPEGIHIYKHYGANYFVPSKWASSALHALLDAPLQTPSGTLNNLAGQVWKMGRLAEESIPALGHTISYDWIARPRTDLEDFTIAFGRVPLVGDAVNGRPRQSIYRVPVYAGELGKQTVSQDGAIHTTTYSNYDNYGNPGTVVESGPNGGLRTTTLTYLNDTTKWIIGKLKNETFSGGSTTRLFDTNGNLLSLTRDGVTTSYTYDSQGNMTSKILPRGLVHSYSNYKRGIPQSETQPEGIAISRIVDDMGNVTSETDGEGKTTTYGYDKLNRLTFIVYPAGNAKIITYTATTKTANRGGLVETTSYDGFGRPVKITLAGIVTLFKHDALGRMMFKSDPDAMTGTTYQYDALDRIIGITNADSSYQQHGYGAGTKTITDERGNPTTYTYRSYGNPKQQFLMGIAAPYASASVTLTRNARDLVTSVTQAGFTRSYGYNGNYYLTSVVNPETGVTTYGRDAAGNMTSRTVGSSGPTNYTYDKQNRLQSVTYPGSPQTVNYTYNRVHKMLTANAAGGNRSFGYDNNGNLISESLVFDGLSFGVGYSYNANDQLKAITYPRSGNVVSYSPDILGRPTQVSGYINSVTYWPSGLIKQINYANGTVTNYGQNSRLWPSTFSTQKAGGAAYLNSSYTYDGVGNLLGISDTVDSNYNRALGYDSINRLTSVGGPGGGVIAYNGAGNITSHILGGSVLFYAYDSNNRLNSLSGNLVTSYTYDAYGNIITGLGNTYTYDDVPNLRCVNCADSANKTLYTYDGANHRSSVLKGGIKSYEMYDAKGLQLIEYTPSQAGKLVEYIYLGGKRVAQKVSP